MKAGEAEGIREEPSQFVESTADMDKMNEVRSVLETWRILEEFKGRT